MEAEPSMKGCNMPKGFQWKTGYRSTEFWGRVNGNI